MHRRHQRPSHHYSGHDESSSFGVVEETNKKKEGAWWFFIKVKRKSMLRYWIFALFLTAVMVYYYVCLEFSWVHRRCTKAMLIPTIINAVECSEAYINMKATLNPALWPPLLNDDSIHFVNTTAKHIHYTITSPLEGEVWGLARCSMEGSTNLLCPEASCTINVWIVDHAADLLLNQSSNNTSSRGQQQKQDMLQDITNTLGSSSSSSSWCVRIVHPFSRHSTSDVLIGEGCPSYPSFRSMEAAITLREWLGSRDAVSQLPAHVSDAWRLVALLEIGGLYLDADVLPVSPRLLRIPSPSVPAQQGVGSYRLNGGVLRLGDYSNDYKYDASHSINTAFLRKRRSTKRSTTFLEALKQDHLYWAPRLARVPIEKQTFGFLGPGALTRVYTGDAYQENVTILTPTLVEPSIHERDMSLCTQSLAVHFSGNRKLKWRQLIRNTCVEQQPMTICPHTFRALK